MNNFKYKTIFLLGVALLSFLLMCAWLVLYVPSNMDEFAAYRRIACTIFPNSTEHIFRESCTAYPIRFFGIDFFRSYAYLGISSNLLYLPFYLALPTPSSHHLLGITVLLIFSILLVKALSFPKQTVVIPLIFFPLLFQIVHDTGPIRLALLSYPLVLMLVFKLLDENQTLHRKIIYSLGMFAVVGIAIEDKPFYIYLLPQVLALSVGFVLIQHRQNQVKFTFTKERVFSEFSTNFLLGLLMLIITVSFACILILLFMTVPLGQKGNHYPYLAYLATKSAIKVSFLQEIQYIATYFFIPTQFASRIYDLSSKSSVISILAFIPTILVSLIALKNETRNMRLVILGTIGLGCAVFLLTRNTWSGHHFIFLHIPILILLMRYASSGLNKYTSVVLSILTSSIVSCTLLFFEKEAVNAESNRQPIFEYLSQENIASDAIINFTSWGGFYIQSLYGSRTQLVTYIEPMTKESSGRLLEIFQRSGRKEIINVCSDCDALSIASFFPGYEVSTIDFPNTSWRLVKIQR